MFPLPEFQFPHAFWLLLLVPGWVFLSAREKRRRATALFPLARQWARAPRGWKTRWMWLPPTLGILGWVLAVVALARPQTSGPRQRDLSVEGIDLMLALDVSTSMEAADFRPNNRLHVAKEVLTEFISSRTNDRMGLVVFAGAAYTQAPLTLDYQVLKDVVRQLRTRVIEDGTAIGDALATALNRLRDSQAKSRVVVLITDGDNNAGSLSPLDAAQMASALKIPVYTILVGKGGRVPFPRGTDFFGNPAWVEVEIPINPQLLESMAQGTGGKFFRATDRQSLKDGLASILDAMEKTRLQDGGAFAQKSEDYFPWLLASFLLLALERLLRTTVLRVFP